MIKIGFIGAGNMGSALAQAVSLTDAQIFISDASREKAEAVASELGGTATDNYTIAEKCDLIFFGVKPNVLPSMIDSIKDALDERENEFTIVSMAAGVKTEKITSLVGFKCPVIRIMPNTPVSVGEGMILWCENSLVTDDAKNEFISALAYAGELDEISEELIDAGCALSGCGPAFVYMFIEALSDGAVECGLPRAKATKFAIQTLLGAATLAKGSEEHPEALKDAVCSPGGSTIAGVHALENGAFRANVMSAVKAAFEKTKELGK